MRTFATLAAAAAACREGGLMNLGKTAAAVLCCLAMTATAAPPSSKYRLIYSFTGRADGAMPEAGLLNIGGMLYGTTFEGGTANLGTVFSLNPATGTETVIHSFQGGSDGTYPYAGLVDVDGILYGTTTAGGSDDSGTIFSINPATGAETVVHTVRLTEGTGPTALIYVGRKLYGTASGPAEVLGSVYSLNPANAAYHVLYEFSESGIDGRVPLALLAHHGELYGVTAGGGSLKDGLGVIFSLNRFTHSEKTIFRFSSDTGNEPAGGLTSSAGLLYGTTALGGNGAGDGTVFSLDPDTGAEKQLHAFEGGRDGAAPYGTLVRFHRRLFGMTSVGGAHNLGTIFTVEPNTGDERAVHSFEAGGGAPNAGLIVVCETLYGTTVAGGKYGHGTIFSYTP